MSKLSRVIPSVLVLTLAISTSAMAQSKEYIYLGGRIVAIENYSPGAVTITTTSVPSGIVSTAYSTSLAASGGTTPYAWSIVSGSGSLPAGLTLSSAGVVSGTPTAAGTSNFTVKVTDSS